MDFYGIYTPVITPYHDDFSINKSPPLMPCSKSSSLMVSTISSPAQQANIDAGTNVLLKRGCDVGGRLR